MSDPLRPRLAVALADRYRIERELGAGGMASVWLAHDLRHDRQVAIKVIHPELSQALGAERFLREIAIAARLRHPHILPLYDSGDADGLLYYVMPFVDGETLRDRLVREKQLPVEEAVRLAREVADALAYAHAQGIVHRDIKPENILLDGGHAVVADFGIAKAVRAASGTSTLTGTGTSVGTPAYMSPEQAAGESDLDGRSDQYGLACVLYEMLAGQTPFTGPTVEAVIRQHVIATPPPVTQIRAGVPPAVTAAVARALAKAPADRFARVDEFAAACAAQQSDPALVATPRGAPRWRLPAAALALATMALAGWYALRPTDRETETGTAAAATDSMPSVAVLPFEAIGGSADDPFALGVQAEITTRLTQLGGMRVASRGAASAFRGEQASERTIATELGVGHLLTGSLQRVGDQVRITVALNDAAKGEQRWAESYSRRLSAETFFEIQGEIAQQVATALQARFTPPKGATATKAPTTNLEALDLYYRGLRGWDERTVRETSRAAVVALERAVTLDPAFAPAWGLLAQLRGWQFRIGAMRDSLPAAEALERVASLAPGSLHHRVAAVYHAYQVRGDWLGALRELDAADRLLPDAAELAHVRGLVLRRLGRWQEAEDALQRAALLEPRNAFFEVVRLQTFRYQRRAREARASAERARAIAGGNFAVLLPESISLDLQLLGDTAAAARTLAPLPAATRGSATERAQALLDTYRRRWDSVRALRDTLPLLGNFHRPPFAALHALAYLEQGDRAAARQALEPVRRIAEEVLDDPGVGSDPYCFRATNQMWLAFVLAVRGEADEAVRLADTAGRSCPMDRNALDGTDMRVGQAAVLTQAGRHREAIALLRRDLETPSQLGPGALRLDPFWDPLRNDPEFARLLSDAERLTR